jgi:hypothetical protein
MRPGWRASSRPGIARLSDDLDAKETVCDHSSDPAVGANRPAGVSAAGAWALSPGGTYDPSDQLDVTGVQAVHDGVVVTFTSGGVALLDLMERR